MFQITVRNGKTGHEETTYGIFRYDIEYLYNMPSFPGTRKTECLAGVYLHTPTIPY